MNAYSSARSKARHDRRRCFLINDGQSGRRRHDAVHGGDEAARGGVVADVLGSRDLRRARGRRSRANERPAPPADAPRSNGAARNAAASRASSRGRPAVNAASRRRNAASRSPSFAAASCMRRPTTASCSVRAAGTTRARGFQLRERGRDARRHRAVVRSSSAKSLPMSSARSSSSTSFSSCSAGTSVSVVLTRAHLRQLPEPFGPAERRRTIGRDGREIRAAAPRRPRRARAASRPTRCCGSRK